jgi:hypothetical protein
LILALLELERRYTKIRRRVGRKEKIDSFPKKINRS